MKRPCHANYVELPNTLWARNPPVRFRAAIPTTCTNGKNHQVRRMKAAVGYPTLRLVHVGIGALDPFALGLAPGDTLALPPRAPWDGFSPYA